MKKLPFMQHLGLGIILVILMGIKTVASPGSSPDQAPDPIPQTQCHQLQCDLLEQQARTEFVAGHYLKAASYLLEAQSQGCKSQVLNYLSGKILEVYQPDFMLASEWTIGFTQTGELVSIDKGKVTFWNVTTRQQVREVFLDDAATLVTDVNQYHAVLILSPDGKRLISTDNSDTIKMWELTTGKCIWRFSENKEPVRAVLNDQGTLLLVTCDSGQAYVLDSLTGKKVLTLPQTSGPLGKGCFSHHGKWIVTGAYDGTITIWDLHTGQKIRSLTGHTGFVLKVCFDSSDQRLLSGSRDQTARLWNPETGDCLQTFLHDNVLSPQVGTFNHRGNQVVTVSKDRSARIWDVTTGKLLFRLQHQNWVLQAVFAQDDTCLVTVEGAWKDGFLKVWNPTTGVLQASYGIPGALYYQAFAGFSPDGKWIASLTGRLWQIHHLDQQIDFPEDAQCLEMSADGKWVVAAGTRLGFVRMNLETNERTMLAQADTFQPRAVCVSQDGQTAGGIWEQVQERMLRLFLPSASQVRWYRSGKQVGEIVATSGWYTHFFFSESANQAVLVRFVPRSDQSPPRSVVEIWNLATNIKQTEFTLDRELGTVSALSQGFSKTEMVIGTNLGTVLMYDFNGKQTGALSTYHSGDITSVSISSGGKGVLSSSEFDSTIEVWDVETKQLLTFVENPESTVPLVRFLPHSPLIISLTESGAFGMVQLMDSRTGKTLFSAQTPSKLAGFVGCSPKNLLFLEDPRTLRILKISLDPPSATELKTVLSPFNPYQVINHLGLIPIQNQ